MISRVHSPGKVVSVMEFSLSKEWEGRACIRARAREHGMITMWPKPEQVGVPTSPACALNSVPLTVLASWWVTQADTPRAVSIGPLRSEVWTWETKEPRPHVFTSVHLTWLWLDTQSNDRNSKKSK